MNDYERIGWNVRNEEVESIVSRYQEAGLSKEIALEQFDAVVLEMETPGKVLAEVLAATHMGMGQGIRGIAPLTPERLGAAIKNHGLVAVIKAIGETAERKGLSLTQVFNSAEAASFALLMTGKQSEGVMEQNEQHTEQAETVLVDEAKPAKAKKSEASPAKEEPKQKQYKIVYLAAPQIYSGQRLQVGQIVEERIARYLQSQDDPALPQRKQRKHIVEEV